MMVATREFDNVTTAVLIFNAEFSKVLMTQRGPDEKFPLRIAFPGGRLRSDENVHTSAKREVKEETGLELGLIDYLNVYFDGNTVMIAFVGVADDSTIRRGDKKSFWVRTDLPIGLDMDMAPNVKQALRDAVKFTQLLARRKVLCKLNEVVSTAAGFIARSISSTQDGLLGWDHFIGRGRIGIVGTALGLETMCHAGIRSSLIERGAESLMTNTNPDGGWGLRSLIDVGRDLSVAESTLHVISALLSVGYDGSEKAVSAGASWLRALQDPTGGWGTARTATACPPRVFPTSFALQVLSRIDRDDPSLHSATAWLCSAQNPDGSWGPLSFMQTGVSQGTATHTAKAVIALIEIDMAVHQTEIQRGVEWLTRSYDAKYEQGWLSTSEVTLVDERGRIDYKHFASPWVLVALMKSGMNIMANVIIEPLSRFLQEQTVQGYWHHPFAADHIPIWATHNCIMAMAVFRDAFSKLAGEFVLHRQLKEQLHQLLSKFVLQEIYRG